MLLFRDIIPAGKDLQQTNRNLDEVTDYLLILQNETGIKPLWATCNLFSHPRFSFWCRVTYWTARSWIVWSWTTVNNSLESKILTMNNGYLMLKCHFLECQILKCLILDRQILDCLVLDHCKVYPWNLESRILTMNNDYLMLKLSILLLTTWRCYDVIKYGIHR